MRRLLMAAAFAAAATTASQAEVIDATIVAGHSQVFRWVQMFPEAFEPAVAKALEGTDYEVNFVHQFGGTIAGVGEELETIEDGLAQLGTVQSLFRQAKMPLQNVTYYTPFVSNDVRLVSEVMVDLTRDHEILRKAYDDAGIISLGGTIGIDSYLLLTNFPVNSMEDLKGRKIATAGAAVNWLNGTGAVGVSSAIPAYYNDLKTGVYEGVILFATGALPAKLHEVVRYITKIGFGAQVAGSIGVNREWFEGLPEPVQEALRAGAAAAGEWYLTSLEQGTAAALETMAAQGATITEPDEAFRQAWADSIGDLAGDWARSLDAMGQPGTETLKLYMNEMRARGATPLRAWGEE